MIDADSASLSESSVAFLGLQGCQDMARRKDWLSDLYLCSHQNNDRGLGHGRCDGGVMVWDREQVRHSTLRIVISWYL